jgi:hypothetical protein
MRAASAEPANSTVSVTVISLSAAQAAQGETVAAKEVVQIHRLVREALAALG